MISSRKPSILILYAGGTIGMRQDVRTSALMPALSVEDLITYAPFLEDELTIKTKTITNIDSTNMQPDQWATIAKEIHKEYDHYDGFVILHGTDTMSYTASAVSFAMRNLGKPIIFTGAQVPAEMLGSDAINNLIAACQAATMDFAEVAIVFGTKILRANRSVKVSESERDAFICPVFPPLGSIRLTPELTYKDVLRRHGGKPTLENTFIGNVPMIKLVPGMDPAILDTLIDAEIDGLVLESFGPGNIPNINEQSLVPPISRALEKGVPVLIASQCIYGTTRMYLYEVGKKIAALGVIPARDMTPEAAFVKLKWALGQTQELAEIKTIFEQDISGEVTIS